MKRKGMVVLTLALFILVDSASAVSSFAENVSTELASSAPAIQLSAGDLDRDGRVTVRDRSMLLEAFYYGQAVADFAERGSSPTGMAYEDLARLRDLDEDGQITVRDLLILMKAFSFGRGIQVVPYH